MYGLEKFIGVFHKFGFTIIVYELLIVNQRTRKAYGLGRTIAHADHICGVVGLRYDDLECLFGAIKELSHEVTMERIKGILFGQNDSHHCSRL
uniref:Uncharacterized protein n=1 Tax=Kalanchoe fedtschenkoi TaxID=63787 RepID=A0A7N0UMQ8_KALFE